MAETVGIVAEYNPFHNGHQAQLNRIREHFGRDTVIVAVMSGDFVQRGEPAILNKHARAEAACRGGADLVLELPLPWSVLSAEGFAEAGIFLLNAVHVGTVCFGTETDDLSLLEDTAEQLLRDDTQKAILQRLSEKPNLSYAAARADILSGSMGFSSEWLAQPNSILALEYVKAIKRNGYTMGCFPVRRIGAGHDSDTAEGDICSASYLRRRIESGEIPGYVPPASEEILRREIAAGRGPVSMNRLETALLARVRMLSEDVFSALPDAGGGMGEKLYRAVRSCAGYEEICAAAKTKRYAMSRIRRMLLCAALGVDADMAAWKPPYIRVLAASHAGCEYLAGLRKTSLLPVIVRPSDAKTLPWSAPEIFQLGADARDFYVLGYPKKEERRPGSDYRASPSVGHRQPDTEPVRKINSDRERYV